MIALALAVAVAPLGPAESGEAAGFFRGRQISLIVGYGPGGGYDVYGRLVGRHMGRFLSGHPTIVVQNMPGAGSLVATNYLYRIAPKDGTVIGTFARNMPLVGLLGNRQNVQFEPLRFTWLGSSSYLANDAYVLLARKSAAASTIAELSKPGGAPLVIGSTAEGASSDTIPSVMRNVMGLNIRSISGYTDSGKLFLAIERGEIDGRTVALSAVRANKPDWIKPDGPMNILLAFGRQTRLADFPDVPIARELAKSEAARGLLDAIEITYKIARPFAAPPGVPVERARALQAAFLATHRDPQFLADAERLGVDISPVAAGDVLELIRRVSETPPEMLRSIERLMEGG